MNQKQLKLAGEIGLFIGIIYFFWFFGILITGHENTEMGLGLLLSGIIYTPLGYFVLYKKNRWGDWGPKKVLRRDIRDILEFMPPPCFSPFLNKGPGA